MLSFHLPLDCQTSKCSEYRLEAKKKPEGPSSLQVRISLKDKCLDLAVDSSFDMTWHSDVSKEIDTAANSDEAQSPSILDEEGDEKMARGPPLSYQLHEFNSNGCLQADIVHKIKNSPIKFFRIMILIDNYLRPRSSEGELEDSSLGLLDRWGHVFPRAVQLGHDIIAELADAYSCASGDQETRMFIANLAAKVFGRAKEWIEELWVGQVDHLYIYQSLCKDHPANFEEEFTTAAASARFQLQLAAIECELGECLMSIDDDRNHPEALITIAIWLSEFNGPIDHLMAYVREVVQGFENVSHGTDEDNKTQNLMAGLRSQIMHLVRCSILRCILLKTPTWLGSVDGTGFANILRAGAMDFHCAYASRMCLKDPTRATEFLRYIALAESRGISKPENMRELLCGYTIEELLPGLNWERICQAPSLNLEELWSSSSTVEEVACRFALAAIGPQQASASSISQRAVAI